MIYAPITTPAALLAALPDLLDFFSAHHLRQEDSALVLADGTLSITAANHTHTYTITVKPINYEAP